MKGNLNLGWRRGKKKSKFILDGCPFLDKLAYSIHLLNQTEWKRFYNARDKYLDLNIIKNKQYLQNYYSKTSSIQYYRSANISKNICKGEHLVPSAHTQTAAQKEVASIQLDKNIPGFNHTQAHWEVGHQSQNQFNLQQISGFYSSFWLKRDAELYKAENVGLFHGDP